MDFLLLLESIPDDRPTILDSFDEALEEAEAAAAVGEEEEGEVVAAVVLVPGSDNRLRSGGGNGRFEKLVVGLATSDTELHRG